MFCTARRNIVPHVRSISLWERVTSLVSKRKEESLKAAEPATEPIEVVRTLVGNSSRRSQHGDRVIGFDIGGTSPLYGTDLQRTLSETLSSLPSTITPANRIIFARTITEKTGHRIPDTILSNATSKDQIAEYLNTTGSTMGVRRQKLVLNKTNMPENVRLSHSIPTK